MATDTKSRIVLGQRTPVITITITSVFTALVFLTTYLFQIPIISTQGYFNLGDVMIFVTALTFGPMIGGFAGGVGSSLSDFIGGFGTFAPFTLVIKGLEGLIAGLIAQRSASALTLHSLLLRLLAAWAVGCVIMVGGYFLAESFVIALVFGSSDVTGIVAALGELPFNIFQVVIGGIVGIPVALILRWYLRSTAFSSRNLEPLSGPTVAKKS